MEKIRTLILTTKGGQGLISGSVALKQYLEQVETVRCDVEIVDFFEQGNIAGKYLTKLYNLLLKKSLRINAVFVKLLHTIRVDRWRLFYKTTDRYFLSLLTQKKPDMLIVTSEYIVHYIASTVQRFSLSTPVYVANIDPGTPCLPLWFHPEVRLHLLPTIDTLHCYRQYGFLQHRAKVVGLLVRKEFTTIHRTSKTVLRNTLGWPRTDFSVVFAGSREGYSGIISLVKMLANMTDWHLVVVCGKNRSMHKRLQKLVKRHQWNMSVFGWREDMHTLMRAADVVVAKPGKQTMKEAIACHVPMIALAYPAVMEQERGNIAFMTTRGLLLIAKSNADVIHMATRLQEDHTFYTDYVETVRSASVEIQPVNVAQTICDDVLHYQRKRRNHGSSI